MHFLTYALVLAMELSKNNQAVKNKEKEIRKATTAMRTQGGGSSTQATHASKKKRYTFDVQSPGKGTGGSNTRPKVREGAAGPPHHGVGKGFMTFQGPIVPPPLPLLVKDKEYAIDIAYSIVRDADLDKCFEYETDPLGDSGLHDMMRGLVRMRALQVRCVSREALIKRLNERIGYEADAKQKFKESSSILFQ